MPQLDPQFYVSQVFWLVIVFSVIYLYVSKVFFKRIGNVVEQRSRKVSGDIAFSEESVEKYKELKERTSSVVEKARQDAFALSHEATENFDKEIATRMLSIEHEMFAKLAVDEERIARVKAKVLSKMDDIVSSIEKDITKHVIDKDGLLMEKR